MSKSKKTLILYDSVEYFMSYMESQETDVFRIYRKRNFVISLFKRAFLKLNIFCSVWYESWVQNLSSYNTVLVFATRDYTFIRRIKKRYPNIRIIFWYWNPAFRMGVPRNELYSLAEIWSFDPADCVRYALNFNTTFYFRGISLQSEKIKYDAFFLGINKGRREFLEGLKKKLDRWSINTYFYIVPDKKEKEIEEKKPIPYHEYLYLLSQSSCIIDIMPQGQTGLTLRAMESLFFCKKLITNDLSILNQDFYSPHNIFVLEKDNLESIRQFIDEPYKSINPDIVNKYDFNSWLNRFDGNG
ncbi:hypothetical protein [Sphingobacterium haloxyli]|uniref:Glycosyltransferase n=1 Tax=Sphingobacterium haloxyli TaxID=2100533 RepID=A0A2S9J219_9SPHI|nr:hypothetical protein [Sphingobacterium haloxyli]PRD46812.1 hypothetical protein C5745_13165 [Sphingobacterium haloxyli]